MMALGGFSSRAHMLHIKPFDNSYKKARKSYERDDESKTGKTMKIKLVEDGNLTSWLRLMLIVIGTAFIVVAVECKLAIFWARVLLLSGFAIALVGGMTSRAKLLHIKPFDNSYKKARESYEKDDESKK